MTRKPPRKAPPRSNDVCSDCTTWQIRAHASPITTAVTTATSVSTMPVRYLASSTRERRGSREKVTIAVRWVHSLVTSMIASTGSTTAVM